MPRQHLPALALALALLASGCGGEKPPTGIDPGPGPVRTLQEFSGTHNAGEIHPFTFQGTAGTAVAVFLQALTGTREIHLTLEVVGPGSTGWLASASSPGSSPSLDAQLPAFVVLPVTGTYAINVRGFGFAVAGGPYRVRLASVDLAPEQARKSVAVRDTVSGESIDEPGDSDDFTFTAAADQELLTFLQTTTAGAKQFDLTLFVLDATTGSVLGTAFSAAPDSGLRFGSSQLIQLRAGRTYTVRVRATQRPYQGAYRFELFQLNRAPEQAAPLLREGVPASEAIDPNYDSDEFTFDGTAGQKVEVVLTRSDMWSSFAASVWDPAGTVLVPGLALRGGPWDPLPAVSSSGLIVLPVTGRYTIRVGNSNPTFLVPRNTGPYQLLVRQVP